MRRLLAGDGPPNVASIALVSSNPSNLAQVQYRVLFDEVVQASTVNVADFALTSTGSISGRSVASVVSSAGAGVNSDTYIVTANTGTGSGTLRLDVIDSGGGGSIRDLTGDRLGGPGNSDGTYLSGPAYTIDKVAPTLSPITRLDTNPSPGPSVRYALLFSESVSGLSVADFQLTSNGLTNSQISSITGSGTSYTLTVSTGTGEGSLQVQLVDDDTIVDAAGNRLGGTGIGNGSVTAPVYTVDAVPPTAVSSTPMDAIYTSAASVRFAYQFSELVTGIDVNDFVVAATGTLTGTSITSVTGSGSAYVVTINTGSGSGNLAVNLAGNASYVDANGNAGSTTSPAGPSYTIDRERPIVTLIAPDAPNPSNQSSAQFTVRFSEAVTGVDISDFSLTAVDVEGASLASVTGSGTDYTVTINTGSMPGTLTLNLDDNDSIVDAGGNFLNGVGTSTATYVSTPPLLMDRAAPMILSITRLDAIQNALQIVRFQLDLTEDTFGLDPADFFTQNTQTLAGTFITSVTGSGTRFVVSVNTGTGSGIMELKLVAQPTYFDALGNQGGNFTPFSSEIYVIDKAPPTVPAVWRLDPTPTSASTLRYEVNFSERIAQGIDAQDFTAIVTGTVSGVTISDITLQEVSFGTKAIVTLTKGLGAGTVALRVLDDDSILDGAGLPLGGVGQGNGSFTSSDIYTVEWTPASGVSGLKWNDLDGDGVRDPDEPGIGGFTIYADLNNDGQLNAGEPSTITAADGTYTLGNLNSGTYTIREASRADWEQTYPSNQYPITALSAVNGITGSSISGTPSTSADGRYVAFQSNAILLPNDTTTSDIFVWDRLTNTLERVSVGLAGALSDRNSYEPSISNDGNRVTFTSAATNLVAGDTNGVEDVFVFDRTTRVTTRVSIGPGGVQGNNSSGFGEKISGDGQYVVFQSTASNLVSGDTNGVQDIFLYSFATGTVQRISASGTTQANAFSNEPDINDDGSVIVFESNASNLVAGDTNANTDIFAYFRASGTIRRVSVSSSGVQANTSSQGATVSGNGRYVGYWTNANFAPEDTSPFPEVYLYDLQTGGNEVVSFLPGGALAGPAAMRPSLSTDARYVAFHSNSSASSVYSVDEVYIFDRVTRTSRLVTRNQLGQASDGDSHFVSLSDDGKFVAFESDGKRLVPNDNNYLTDVFFVDVSQPYLGDKYSVTLAIGQIAPNLDFGNRFLSGQLSGKLWTDYDRDRTIDPPAVEPPISGRTVFLDTNNDGALSSGEINTTSDSLGNYRFDNLASGLYRVREQLPALWTETVPTTPYDVATGVVTQTTFDFEDVAFFSSNFNLIGDYVRSGFVFSTTSYDSSQWRIYGTSSTPTPPSTELVADSVVETHYIRRLDNKVFDALQMSLRYRSGSGDVTFVGERANGSRVTQTVTPGITATNFVLNGFTDLVALTFKPTGFGGLAIDNVVLSSVTPWVTSGLDFGSAPAPGSISGMVYYDVDQDGTRDPEDFPLVNRRVYLDLNNDGVLNVNESVRSTDANGMYSFTPLDAGTQWVVRQFLPAGWFQSQGNYLVTLEPGQARTSVDFGTWGNPANLSGTKWHDANANGVRDAGEAALAGWTIYLDIDNDGELDASEPSTITALDNPATPENETGTYRFSNVFPIPYVIREVPQVGWIQSSPSVSTSVISFVSEDGYSYGGYVSNPSIDNQLSGNGRYQVFVSGLSLLPEDNNNQFDVYWIDRLTNTLEIVSVSSFGTIGNGSSLEPSVSDDGRYVAFRTFAGNLFSGDTNTTADIVLRDRWARTTVAVSTTATGTGNRDSWEPVLTADGRAVIFWSNATDLVPNDTNQVSDLFYKDLVTGAITRVNTNTAPPDIAFEDTRGGDISADGNLVVYRSFSNDLVPGDNNNVSDIFLWNRLTGQTQLVSSDSFGRIGNGASENRAISDDGRFVVFDSNSTNLTNDVGITSANVYLKDLLTGETTLISRSYTGAPANRSVRPDISADGRWVVFETQSQTMFVDSANTISDIVLYDRLTGELKRITQGFDGTRSRNGSVNAVISRDGSTINFQSAATNLVSNGRAGLYSVARTQVGAPLPIMVTPAPGVTASGLDFGNYSLAGGISGVQYNDDNANGTRDPGELPIVGMQVYVDTNGNGRLDTDEPRTTTDSSGQYSFTNMLVTNHQVRAVAPAGQIATTFSATTPRLFGLFLSQLRSSPTGNVIGIVELDRATGGVLNTFITTIPANNQLGAAFDGTNLLILNGHNQTLYEVSTSGVVLDQTLVSGAIASGLAYVDGLAYFIDSANGWSELVAFNPRNNAFVRRVAITHSLTGYGSQPFGGIGLGLGESPDGRNLVLTALDAAAPDRRLLLLDPITGRVTNYVTPNTTNITDVGATSVGGELFVSYLNGFIFVYDATYALRRTMGPVTTRLALAGGMQYDYATPVSLTLQSPTQQLSGGFRSILSSVTGRVFDDRNDNGNQEVGELSLPGVTVYVDLNLNWRPDSGEPTAVTDPAGNYVLANVPAGQRIVRYVANPGMDAPASTSQSMRLFATQVTAASPVTIFELDPTSGGVLNQFSAPTSNASTATGLAFDGAHLYYLESVSGQLLTLNPETGSTIRSVTLPAGSYDGLAFVAGKLFAGRSGDDSILEVDSVTGNVVRIFDINAINPGYLGVGTTIDLAGSLSESTDGTQLIVTTANQGSYLVNPNTGILEGLFVNAGATASAGAGGEVILSSGSTLVSYNVLKEVVRRTRTLDNLFGLAAAVVKDRAARVSVQTGQDVTGVVLRMQDNSVPTDIVLSASDILEYLPINSRVGEFSAIDANPLDAHQYTLVSGTGDTDNSAFNVAGNRLQSSAIFNSSTKSSYSIRVRATDSVGHWFEKVMTISVVNIPELAAPVQIGTGTTQRSTVDRLVIEFDSQVTLDPGAFVVQKRERNASGELVLQNVPINVLQESLTNGRTRVTVRFTSTYTRPNSGSTPRALVDGNYQLTIVGSKVRSVVSGLQLDGNRDQAAGGDYVLGTQSVDRFYSFFGDFDGNRKIDLIDYAMFRRVLGNTGIVSEFDYDRDGDVDLVDYAFFRRNMGTSLAF